MAHCHFPFSADNNERIKLFSFRRQLLSLPASLYFIPAGA
jgi:hypothetical protein